MATTTAWAPDLEFVKRGSRRALQVTMQEFTGAIDMSAKKGELVTWVMEDCVAKSWRPKLYATLTDVSAGSDSVATVRGVLADLEDITKNVAFRDLDAALACTIGIGSAVWDVVTGAPRPAELHPFREVVGAVHTAPSTPGDLLVHIRANRRDLCFELERQLLDRLHGAVTVVDEVHGFRYFDLRDLIGFVDGTENPVGQAAIDAITVGDEDPAYAGGSYVAIQRYVTDFKEWDSISVEDQEAAIGRTKLDNIEMSDDVKPANAHIALNVIEDSSGEQLQIMRQNMPFGELGKGEFGTYFIGYAADLAVTERMLEMFKKKDKKAHIGFGNMNVDSEVQQEGDGHGGGHIKGKKGQKKSSRRISHSQRRGTTKKSLKTHKRAGAGGSNNSRKTSRKKTG